MQKIFNIIHDDEKILKLSLDIQKDQKNLSEQEFYLKYNRYFGADTNSIKNFKSSAERTMNSEIKNVIQKMVYSAWNKVANEIKKETKPIMKRIRIENDITLMRNFLENKKISNAKKENFIRMSKCEVKSFI